jgi:hypothetical protein
LEGEEKKENSWEERGTLEGKDGFSGFLKLRLLLRQDEVLELFIEVEVEVTEIPNGMLRISWTTNFSLFLYLQNRRFFWFLLPAGNSD